MDDRWYQLGILFILDIYMFTVVIIICDVLYKDVNTKYARTVLALPVYVCF